MLAERTPLPTAVLGIDTCGRAPLAGLKIGSNVRLPPEHTDARADDAATMAASLLASAGIAIADVSALAVTTGPGSYTGLRVGLALVRGLSLVDRLPAVGLGTLELLALAGPSAARVCTVLDAGAGKVYAAVFLREENGVSELVAPRVLPRGGLEAFVSEQKTGVTVLRCATEPDFDLVSAVAIAPADRMRTLVEYAARRVAEGAGVKASLLLPQYVGATGARPNRNKVAVGPGGAE